MRKFITRNQALVPAAVPSARRLILCRIRDKNLLSEFFIIDFILSLWPAIIDGFLGAFRFAYAAQIAFALFRLYHPETNRFDLSP